MDSDGPGRPPPVILDANLLYPFHLRNLLVQLSVDSIITPRWTGRIHEEWIGNLVAAGRAPRNRLLVTLALMNDALPEAEVRGWEAYMEGLTLPDPDDRHVLAAALAAGAKTILTVNLRDFPASALTVHGVVAVHPDNFLCGLHDADPELFRASTEAVHRNLSRSVPSFADYLDTLERQGLPQTTSACVGRRRPTSGGNLRWWAEAHPTIAEGRQRAAVAGDRQRPGPAGSRPGRPGRSPAVREKSVAPEGCGNDGVKPMTAREGGPASRPRPSQPGFSSVEVTRYRKQRSGDGLLRLCA